MKNRSHIYDINRRRPRHGRRYTKYKIYLSIKMATCIKQLLSKIWSSNHEKLSNTEAELKKTLLMKKKFSETVKNLRKAQKQSSRDLL